VDTRVVLLELVGIRGTTPVRPVQAIRETIPVQPVQVIRETIPAQPEQATRETTPVQPEQATRETTLVLPVRAISRAKAVTNRVRVDHPEGSGPKVVVRDVLLLDRVALRSPVVVRVLISIR